MCTTLWTCCQGSWRLMLKSPCSEFRVSLNLLFFSMFSFTFLRLSCFFCMDSFCLLSSSLSSPLYSTSSFSLKMSRASFLLWVTDLVWWHCRGKPDRLNIREIQHRLISGQLTFTTMPVGMCLSTTQLLVLLVACPPGPDPLTNCSSRSSSFNTGRSMRSFLPAAKTNGHLNNCLCSDGENPRKILRLTKNREDMM